MNRLAKLGTEKFWNFRKWSFHPKARASRYALFLRWALAFLWLGVCAVSGMHLHALHQVIFLRPNSDQLQIFSDFASSRAPQTQQNDESQAGLNIKSPQWRLDHFLAGDCGCSKIVFEHLIQRRPIKAADVSERVVLLRPQRDWLQALTELGYDVAALDNTERVPAGMLTKIESLGVPFLAIYSPRHEEVYVGGYSGQALVPGSKVRDLEILDHYRKGRVLAEFPIFGCAVSSKYRKVLDPFGLKYPTAKAE